MGTVFRPYNKGGNDNIQDWQNCQPYGRNVINQMDDSGALNMNRQITSIPSPFARIDLVKTAFRIVASVNGNGTIDLDGKTIYHRMVSDTLDVAEIFFNYEKLKDKVEIIAWDRKKDLQTLVDTATDEGQKILGTTLDMYLTQDAEAYHFDKMDSIYMLNFLNGPEPINIIGATSPATLFFCSANDLSYVTNHINFANGDMPFDKDFAPLYKRDPEFITYLWTLKASYRDFASVMPEFDEYLEQNFTKLNDDMKARLRAVTSQDIDNYEPLTFGQGGSLQVEIISGLKYHVKPQIPVNSDFEIASSIFSGKMPLVLPVEAGNKYKDLEYVQGKWGATNKAPFNDSKSLSERTLPFDGSKHPYLTIGDLLEDTIVRLEYPLNDKAFFNGNLSSKDGKTNFLLPLKSEFFNYFTTDDLVSGNLKDGKMISIEELAGDSVKVTLRIPIKGKGAIRSVVYERIYVNGAPQPEKNRGAIKQHLWEIALTPNVQFGDDKNAFYRIGIIRDVNENAPEISVMKNRQPVKAEKYERWKGYKLKTYLDTYAIERSNFDSIRFYDNEISAFAIPLLKTQSEGNTFEFAVDFGTTNTHIEYKVSGASKNSSPLDVTDSDRQIVYSNADIDDTSRDMLDTELIPELVGQGAATFFPLRTVLSEARNTDWNTRVLPYAAAAASFTYGRISCYDYNKEETNLKWSNDLTNTEKVRIFIESIFMLMRGKVAMGGGRLDKTKVVWFYPTSMTRSRFNLFKKVWEEAYAKYFNGGAEGSNNISVMTESVAPYEYYKTQHPTANMVTVDIGGGTTDVVVAIGGNVKAITSFRFAANNIFGDGYAKTIQNLNGILRLHKSKVDNIIENNKLDDLSKVIADIEAKNDSAELAALLFSLSDNKKIKEKGLQDIVSFSRILKADDKMRIVFLLFYAAIVYHIAKLMKAKQLDMPRYIAFSGNGSKSIAILTTDKDLLAKFTMLVFSRVFEKDYSAYGLTVLFNVQQPKEATCKGGIANSSVQGYDDVQQMKVVLSGHDSSSIVSEDDTYKKAKEDHLVDGVVKEAQEFIDFVAQLNKAKGLNFGADFGIDQKSLDIAFGKSDGDLGVCRKDLAQFAQDGLIRRLEEVQIDDEREETMFFYPLVGMLHNLAAEICDQNINA